MADIRTITFQTFAAAILVAGALAATLIPGQHAKIEELETRLEEERGPQSLCPADLPAFESRISGLVATLDPQLELSALGRYGEGELAEARYRLRLEGGYHRLGALLSDLEADAEISRLTALRINRLPAGGGTLEVVLCVLVTSEEGS